MDDYPIQKIEKKDFKKFPFLAPLLEIPDCPKEIYLRGSLPDVHLRKLAIVGSRLMSNYAKEALEKIISELSGQSICIISGLALGVDGEAHKQALKNNIVTIGIPGSGLGEKSIYPRTNKVIAEKILHTGGLLLSEYPPDFKATVWSFPARNRIMAALAEAVLIVEAGEKSGTLITARLATEYNKDVLAVPGSIFAQGSVGTLGLIKDGAKVVTCGADIMEVFGIYQSSEPKNVEDIKNLTDFEKEILAKITEPIAKDILLQKIKKDTGAVLVTLTTLEWRGLIKEESGILKRV